MKFEKSCGAVVYRINGNIIEFLAVRSKLYGHWGFPKGHVEPGETEWETAAREVFEEAGLEIELHRDFSSVIEYSPKEGFYKEVVLFIGKSKGESVNIQKEEIQDFKWLNYSEMLEQLTFSNDKEVLAEAKSFLDKIVLN